jgi:aminopeptidase N
VACETEGASLWFPCKDHLSDEPDSVRLRMTVPAGLQVVSNGTMQGHTSLQGKDTFTWLTRYPVNIYNITFYAGKYEHFSDTMLTPHGILDLDYHVIASEPCEGEKALFAGEGYYQSLFQDIRALSLDGGGIQAC